MSDSNKAEYLRISDNTRVKLTIQLYERDDYGRLIDENGEYITDENGERIVVL